MINGIQEKRALTIKDAAEYACVSRGTVDNWLRRGLLSYEELPSRGGKYRFIRIRKDTLDKFLNSYEKSENVPENVHNMKNEVFLFPKTS